ncbi:hypothetical protein WDW89_03680 [Deltaproteobacteria bacterium TL4]
MKAVKSLFLLLVLVFPLQVLGMSCQDLDTQEKINAFVKQSKETNPLMRANLSVHLELSPCEIKECSEPEAKARKAKVEQIHLIRKGSDRRIFFVKGRNAPQCAITRDNRSFLCVACESSLNGECRSFSEAENLTQIRGTNIDSADFKELNDDSHTSKCEEMSNPPEILKITTTKIKGDSPYDTIITYYDREKEVPVILNYYATKVLRKVYRFFPKYYVQRDGQWFSTVMRVRTTLDDEQKYVFETLVHVLKTQTDHLELYLNPMEDPVLKNIDFDMLFNTN